MPYSYGSRMSYNTSPSPVLTTAATIGWTSVPDIKLIIRDLPRKNDSVEIGIGTQSIINNFPSVMLQGAIFNKFVWALEDF